MPKKIDELNFEAALKELNTLVEQMEQGGLNLAQSLKNFERGVALVRQCQAALETAEQKVKILTEQEGQISLASYENEDEDEEQN